MDTTGSTDLEKMSGQNQMDQRGAMNRHQPRQARRDQDISQEGSAASADARNEAGPVAVPAVDILEDENGIQLFADMPGVSGDTVQLHLDNDTLEIRGDVALRLPEGLSPLLTEFNARRYARSFTLSRELDASRISAEMNAGVLRVMIPKSEASKPRKIDVKVS